MEIAVDKFIKWGRGLAASAEEIGLAYNDLPESISVGGSLFRRRREHFTGGFEYTNNEGRSLTIFE